MRKVRVNTLRMTFSEAIDAIEKRASKLKMRDREGELLEPMVAIGRIGVYHGQRFDHILDAFENGKIPVEIYFTEMIKMIMEYQNRIHS